MALAAIEKSWQSIQNTVYAGGGEGGEVYIYLQ